MLTIYHNPRCSKSREALALLEAAGEPVTIIRYLETPPDRTMLETLIRQLNLPVRALLRSKEEEYETLGLANPALTDADIITLLTKHPRLLERPIVVNNNRAVIARPPERLKELLT